MTDPAEVVLKISFTSEKTLSTRTELVKKNLSLSAQPVKKNLSHSI